MTAGKRAQPLEMRLDMAKQRIRQMDAKQIRQRRIGAVEIHARGIRREQPGLIRRNRRVVMLAWLVHLPLLSARSGLAIPHMPYQTLWIMLQIRRPTNPPKIQGGPPHDRWLSHR